MNLRVKTEKRKLFNDINDFNRKANRGQNICFFAVAHFIGAATNDFIAADSNWKIVGLFNSKIEISFDVAACENLNFFIVLFFWCKVFIRDIKLSKFNSNFFVSIFVWFSSAIERSFDIIDVETNDVFIIAESISLIILICLTIEISFNVENLIFFIVVLILFSSAAECSHDVVAEKQRFSTLFEI